MQKFTVGSDWVERKLGNVPITSIYKVSYFGSFVVLFFFGNCLLWCICCVMSDVLYLCYVVLWCQTCHWTCLMCWILGWFTYVRWKNFFCRLECTPFHFVHFVIKCFCAKNYSNQMTFGGCSMAWNIFLWHMCSPYISS